jgi:hypothetical protein
MSLPCVLIPAYKPDTKMIDLIEKLQSAGFTGILVINDGSGPDYNPIFSGQLIWAALFLRTASHGHRAGNENRFNHGSSHGLFATV